MSGVNFDLHELNGLATKLAKAGNLDMDKMLTAIGVAMISSTSRRFSMGVDPDGVPWKPSRRAQNGGKTLVDTTRLEKSVNFISYSSQKKVEIGSNLKYARIHQKGGIIQAKDPNGYLHFIGGDGKHVMVKRVVIPKRSYLGINQGDKKTIVGIVNIGIKLALQGA